MRFFLSNHDFITNIQIIIIIYGLNIGKCSCFEIVRKDRFNSNSANLIHPKQKSSMKYKKFEKFKLR